MSKIAFCGGVFVGMVLVQIGAALYLHSHDWFLAAWLTACAGAVVTSGVATFS